MARRVKKAFSLVEMIIVTVLFGMIIVTVTSLFVYMYKIKGWLEARQTLTKESYFLLEKLNTMIKNYTIDYEEYRNRRRVGCKEAGNPQWADTCTLPTYYWNKNGVSNQPDVHKFFYCSSLLAQSGGGLPSVFNSWVSPVDHLDTYFGNCMQNAINVLSLPSLTQSYGQYAMLFTDVKEDVDYVPGAAWDDDDTQIWRNFFQSVYSKSWFTPSELYLISFDKKKRLYIRRKQIEQGDYNGDGIVGETEKLYSLQILQLRWFDAWESHDFQWPGVYDGVIDTRACDYSLGFNCSGSSIQGAYPEYHMPIDEEDGRKNLLSSDITITDWKLDVQPTHDPKLSWNSEASQINPYIRVAFVSKLYWKNRSRKLDREQINNYSLSLQTAFSFLP